MLYTKNLSQYYFHVLDPWSDILSSITWDIISSHCSTLKASPNPLGFNYDVHLLLTGKLSDLEYQEIGDKELVTESDIHGKLNSPTEAPCSMIQVYSSDTVKI